jgi:hypothetical protein
MADGHFWWAFAGGPVFELERDNFDGPARCPRTRAGWSKASLNGEPLNARGLSSALTRTASYQMTICTIKHSNYLLRRIRGERRIDVVEFVMICRALEVDPMRLLKALVRSDR